MICKQSFLLILFTLISSVIGWSVVVKKYRENKIQLTTFDNSNHYNLLSPTNISREHQVLVLFGDSRIKQWNPILELDEIDILNRGISGETTAQMMLRFKKDVLDTAPDIIVIQAGINDLVAASIADNYELKTRIYTQCLNNIKKMVNLAVSKQKVIVILIEVIEPYRLGLIRSLVWGNDLTNLVQNINEDLSAITNLNDVYLLNANKILQKEGHQWKPGVNRDALHFTARAYHLLNVEIARLIESTK